jgi:hypothetical protein
MTIRKVKVSKPIVPADGPWLITSEDGLICETINPDERLRELVGGRLVSFYKAERTAEGWKWLSRWKGRADW